MSLTPESMHMLTWLFSPRGIPKDFRHMDGFGVNTYRMVNAAGEGVLVKYHWKTQQGVESLTQAQADAIQATELGSASKDLYEAIERGDFPRWELQRPDHVATTSTRSSTSTRSTTPRPGRRTSSRSARSG